MKSTFSKSSITLEQAQSIALATCAKAMELEMSITVCIVDESGQMKLFNSMDQAPIISLSVAKQKAVTAVGFGIPTGDSWYNFIKDDPILNQGMHDVQDFVLLGGGSPIMINDELVGAIGVSGGHYKQDEECVQAGLSAIKLLE
jgi:uncharacterized protein GlcG (DUF336 family)